MKRPPQNQSQPRQRQWRARQRRLGQRFWLGIIAAGLTVILHLMTAAAEAQVESQPAANPKGMPGVAPVVVDGNVVFEVRDVGAMTAAERAGQINQKLQQEVRSPERAEIDIVRENSLLYLQSENTDEILTTITEADVSDFRRSPYQQAQIWAETLQEALRQGQLERQPTYIHQALIYSLVVMLGAIAIHLVLHLWGRWMARRIDQWSAHTSPTVNEWTRPIKLFWQLGLLGIQVGLWATVAYTITDTFPQARGWRYQIFNLLTARIINLGTSNYSALELLLFLLLTVGLWLVVSFVTRLLRLYVLNRAGVDQRVQDILGVLVQYALTFLGVVILLQIWGIDLSSLAILASVLGVGLGFGVQNITNNFISGFIITLERPIQVGDFINVGELVGTVERIGARSTEIRTLDQVTIIVPNSRFLENEVINWSHGDPVSRLHLPVGVAYGSNIDRVKRALLDAVRRHPEVLLRPRPEVWFHGFGDSSLDFELMVWTGEPRKQYKVRSDLYYEIEASLRRYNIEIPFPQRVLHLRSPQLDDLLAVLKQNLTQASLQRADLQRNLHHPDLSAAPNSIQDHAANSSTSPSTSEAPNAAHSSPDHPSQAHQPPVNPSYHSPSEEPTSDEATDLTLPNSFVDPYCEQFPVESPQAPRSLNHLDLDALADEMHGPSGIAERDRHYQSKRYPACFTGAEAVEWLIQQHDYSRDEALLIGQSLLQQGFIRGLIDDTVFRDGYYFYRFYRNKRNSTPSGTVF